MHICLAVIVIAAFALPSFAQTSASTTHKPPSSAEVEQARAMMQFKAAPVFRDEHGKTITQNTFDAATRSGRRYTATPDMKARVFIMQLLPPGVNTPGSMSAANVTSPSISLIEVKGIHYKVVFHDGHGKPIDQKTFAAGASQHQRYTMQLDKTDATATLTLLPIGANKPGSQLTSDWAVTSPMNGTPIPNPGAAFPPFKLPRVGGGTIDTTSLKGQPYVVDFFFADCIGCIAELPELNAYHRQYPQRRVIAMTFDDAKTAADFVKQRHFDWPVVYDGKAFTDKLGIKAYPTMVVVGADGKVLATRLGAQSGTTAKSLETWVSSSLAHASGK